MSQGDDRLLKTLGSLARDQAREAVPTALVGEPSVEGEARAAERALAALGLQNATDVSAEHAVRGMRPPPLARPQPSFWDRLRQRWAVAMAIPSLAVLALFLIRGLGGGSAGGLPAYGLEAVGGVAETRGPEGPGQAQAAPLRLAPGASVELRLRPAETVTGPVDVRVYWVKDGRAQRLAGLAEHAEGGAIRVRARAQAPFGAGAGEVVTVVGRPQALPSAETLDASALAKAPEGAQVLRHDVVWLP
jgi:hypothetical protein